MPKKQMQDKKVPIKKIEEVALKGGDTSAFFGKAALGKPIVNIQRRQKKNIQTVNIDFPTELLAELDQYATSLNIARAAAVKTLLREALNAQAQARGVVISARVMGRKL